MKVNKFISHFMFRRIRKGLKQRYGNHATSLIKKAKSINKELFAKLNNISRHNPMASRMQIALPVIAVWLASDRNIKIESMSDLMYKALDTLLIRFVCGSFDMNKKKDLKRYIKKIHKMETWAGRHPGESNSWRFTFDETLHKEGCYHSVKYCPLAEFCKENGYEDIAPALCKIDYLTVQLRHGVLLRNKTIAAGDDICDFWIVGDKRLAFIKW